MSDDHRCRLCTTNDVDGLIEELAERLWNARRDDEAGIGNWVEAGDYWHKVMRSFARETIATLRHR